MAIQNPSAVVFQATPKDSSQRLLASTSADSFVGAFHFEILIQWDPAIFQPTDGATLSQLFTRVSGIVSESERMEFMQGTDPYIRVAPGRNKFAEVNLERVFHGVDCLYQWRLYVQRGNVAPLNVDVYMKLPDGTDVRHVSLIRAWPCRWELPEMDATSSGPAIEKIVLAVEEIIEHPVT